MKKVFLIPFIQVISINTNDIISTSGELFLGFSDDAAIDDEEYSD